MNTTIRQDINLVEASTRPAKLETTPLPYDEKALEPVLSKESINYHYDHLAKGYAKRYNADEGNANFNRAGSFLHNKFFPQLRAPKGANRPKGAVLALIEEHFKTYEDFREEFKKVAMAIQGSGWGWLVYNPQTNGLEFRASFNQEFITEQSPAGIVPIFNIDIWEHAFYIDYKSAKVDFLKEIWKVVNWQKIEERFADAKKAAGKL
jgi:Fe-Mn family superoxide dismutase